jgi:hypothetical protein
MISLREITRVPALIIAPLGIRILYADMLTAARHRACCCVYPLPFANLLPSEDEAKRSVLAAGQSWVGIWRLGRHSRALFWDKMSRHGQYVSISMQIRETN